MLIRPKLIPGGLVALILLLSACGDDPSTPDNEVYRAETVQVDGAARALPARLYDGPATVGGSTENARVEVRRATLILRRDGRYEFSGDYRAELAGSGEFALGSFEDGRYSRRGDVITFDALSSSATFEDRYLNDTGTIRNGMLTVQIADPLFEDLDGGNLYTFRP